MNIRLEGKVALVIGSLSGIGRSVAVQLAACGASVVVTDFRHYPAGETLLDELETGGGRPSFQRIDFLQPSTIIEGVQAVVSRYGRLDILINNAGLDEAVHPFESSDWAQWDDLFAVNVKGAAIAIACALPHMRGNSWGRIINTASQLAHKPAPLNAAYCASKAALVALTSSIAHEVAEFGITVNSVCPGPTDTQMWNTSDPSWNAWKVEQLPIKRVGTPEEVASAYVYLCSDLASFMIGQSLSPNGGDVMW